MTPDKKDGSEEAYAKVEVPPDVMEAFNKLNQVGISEFVSQVYEYGELHKGKVVIGREFTNYIKLFETHIVDFHNL